MLRAGFVTLALLAAGSDAVSRTSTPTSTNTASNTFTSTSTASNTPSNSATRSNTPSVSPTIHTPSITPSSSAFPNLVLEKWGVYDLSGDPGTDPTVLLPAYLWRDLVDNNLYLELPHYINASSNPTNGEWTCRGSAYRNFAPYSNN